MTLKRIVYLSTILTMLTIAGGAMAGTDGVSNAGVKPNVNMPVTELKWHSTGVVGSDGIGTLQAAPAYGDHSKGEHATLVKMPARFVSTVHTHTDDYHGVVINGVATNASVGEKEIPLPPGSYWFQPGGKPHVTKCISTSECLFFISQKAKFDYLSVAH